MKTFRKTVNIGEGSIKLPTGFKFIVLQNTGTNPMAIYFEAGSSSFFTLKPDHATPTMHIESGQTVYHKSIGGSTILEAIVWR